jgi:hypothetical protein
MTGIRRGPPSRPAERSSDLGNAFKPKGPDTAERPGSTFSNNCVRIVGATRADRLVIQGLRRLELPLSGETSIYPAELRLSGQQRSSRGL